MASELTPTYDSDAGQVVLEGLPTGAAGGAGLVPAAGLELEFDRADGRLARAVVGTGQPGWPIIPGEAAAGALGILFGQQALTTVRDAAAATARDAAAATARDAAAATARDAAAATARDAAAATVRDPRSPRRTRRALSPDPQLSATWSRLARLESARASSPVPASPLWPAEAAQLAERAGLHGRARAEAQRAAPGLAELLSHASLLPEALAHAALAVADIVEPDEPDAARQLRDYVAKLPGGSLDQWLAEPGGAPAVPDAPGSGHRSPGPGQEQIPGLQWSLDPHLLPERVFLPGLSPLSDLVVRRGDGHDRVIVEGRLAPGADLDALGRCRARVVDPPTRRVLASAPFLREGSRVQAELITPFPIDELKETWVEVVDDEWRPVRSERLRRIRRALRWADAALRAEQRPPGLAPRFTGQEWAALAASAWARSSRDWEDTGDTDRAFLASRRLAALDPGTRLPEAPSSWAADLAGRPPLREPAFLAEAIGR